MSKVTLETISQQVGEMMGLIIGLDKKIDGLETYIEKEISDLALMVQKEFKRQDDRFMEFKTYVEDGFESIDARLVSMDSKFESINARLESMDSKFESIDAKFVSIDARFEELKEYIDKENSDLATMIQNEFKNQNSRFDRIEGRLDNIEFRLDRLEKNSSLTTA